MDWLTTWLADVHPADWAFTALLVFFALKGLIRGLSRELAATLAWVVILLGGWRAYQPISAWLLEHTRLQEMAAADMLALITSLIVLLLLMRLGGLILHKLLDLAFPDSLERIGGLIAGLVKGGMVTGLILLGMQVSRHETLRTQVLEPSWFGRMGSVVIPEFMARWRGADFTEPCADPPEGDADGR